MREVPWEKTNTVFAILLALGGLVWFFQLHTFGIALGLVGLITAFFLYRKQRWAYFVAAAWSFGLMRIAMDDGYDFHQGYQGPVKLLYVIGMIIPIVLHEKVLKKKK